MGKLSFQKNNIIVSVVLSTYNGSKYVIELLDSLKNQSLRIDEVIISDDASSDNTVDIVKEYIKKYSLKNWKLIEHSTNRGWKINFKDALQLAHGKYIFPCDQDDIWKSDKINSMVQIMDNNKDILLLVSDYEMFGEYRSKKIISNYSGDVIKANFEKDYFYIKRPGCVFCARKELINYIPDYAFDSYPHDAFLWRTACMLNGLYFFNKPTIQYRRHSETATGREVRSGEIKLKTIEYYGLVLEYAEKFMKEQLLENPERINFIKKYKKWILLRKRLFINHKLIAWVQLLRYFDCYFAPKSYFGDLFFAIKK